tara:strand:- start:1328 stop:1573 length:246 start_codon:yes stop_codon:yes gene_type:complete
MAIIKNHIEEQNDFEMDPFKATMIAEGDFAMVGVDCPTEELVIRAWQYLLDTGLCWSLQGWFSRTAKSLIDQGIITESEVK